MGVKQKIYGFAVFTATCMLVFSYPKLHGGRRDATNHLRYVSSRLHRRSIHEPAEDVAAAASSDDDHPGQSATMMWSSLLITGLITAALVLVLALCTCGKKSKSNNQASSPDEEEIKPEETNEVTQQPVGNGPSSPVVMTVDSPITPRTPSPEMHATREPFTPISPNGGAAVQVHSPPSPTFDMADIPYADAVSISPQHQPTRGATINRRLPQLPQSPPPAVPDGDDTEKDYDLTYDVIPEKRKDATPIDDMYDKGGGYERLRDTKANGLVMPSSDHVDAPYAKVDEGRKKKPVVELETTDHNYNSIEETRGGGGAGKRSPPLAKPDLEIDGHYASVGDDEEKDGVYARVKDRSREGVDRSNGYARVRDVQNGGPTTASSSSELMSGDSVTATRVSPLASHRSVELAEDEEDEDDDVPPAIPEKMPDLENGMDIKPVSPATHTQRLPSVGNSPGPSPHADRTSPAPPGSPQLINSQSGLAASIAAGTAAVANNQQDGQQNNTTPSNVQVKEKPYTQVSARESLEFVRARQQAEHTACSMAHYEFVNENDYDGIYETVNEGQMSPQPERPPPLPNNRQPGPQQQVASPTPGWQQAPIARAALYEEINENDRPQPPPGAAVAAATPAADADEEDDDMQPYAVTQKSTRQTTRTAQRSAPNATTGAVYAQVDKDRGASGKASDLYSQVKRPPGGSVRAAGNHDMRSNVEGPPSPPAPVMSPNQPRETDNELYAKVQKMPSVDGAQKRINGMESHGGVTLGSSPPEGVGPDQSYQSIDEVMNENGDHNGVGAAGLVYVSQNSGKPRNWKPKEHTYQAVDNKNVHKKGKKEKKDKKKDHQNNRTPSPQPQTNPWKPRFPVHQHSGYEEVNVNNAPVLQTVDNANKRSRSRTNSREQVRVNGIGNQETRVRTNSREQVGKQDMRIRTNSREYIGNQDTRVRTNSREQVRVNGIVPQQGNRSRTNSREPVVQDTRGISQENGNNNCSQVEYFLPSYVQETRL